MKNLKEGDVPVNNAGDGKMATSDPSVGPTLKRKPLPGITNKPLRKITGVKKSSNLERLPKSTITNHPEEKV